MKKPLNGNPSRSDLTDRECASLIGGTIGAMVQMSDPETVRNAIRWWAETDEAWAMFVIAKATTNRLFDAKAEAEGVAN